MGGEEECARTGDSNPGCNYLVRAWHAKARAPGRGRVRECWLAGPRPCLARARAHTCRRGRGRARWFEGPGCAQGRGRGRARRLACQGLRPGSRPCTCALASGPAPVPRVGDTRPRTHLAATVPCFSPVCANFLAEVFHFLTDISV